MRPCLDCGEPSDEVRCPTCSPPTTKQRGSSPEQRGYGWHWRMLSRRARALQPFCSDCGTTERLTTDHTPEAWERQARGLEVRLVDIDVVCADHNVRRGSSRPGTPRATS